MVEIAISVSRNEEGQVIYSATDLLEYVDALPENATTSSLKDAVSLIRDYFQVKHLSICVIVDPGGCSIADRVFTTYDPEWIQRYVANRYWMADPVLSGFYNGLDQLSWRDDPGNSENVAPFVASFISASRRYGVGSSGHARYVRLGVRGSYVLTISSDEDSRLFSERVRRQTSEIQLVALQLSLGIFGLASGGGPTLTTLLDDEMMVLRLLASGFDSYEICLRLTLARSVESIIESILRKLKVANVTEAIYQFGSLRADEFLPPADFEIKSVQGGATSAKRADRRR